MEFSKDVALINKNYDRTKKEYELFCLGEHKKSDDVVSKVDSDSIIRLLVNGIIFKESIRFSQKKNSQNSCSKSDDFQLYRVADFYQDIWDLYSFFHAKNLLISLKVS